jgi:hypothetical protein
MSQHVHELSHQNIDEEMTINVVNNELSDVVNRPEILSNEGTNGNTSRSTVRNSFNRSSNEQILNKILNELKEVNQGFIELDKKVQTLQNVALTVIVSE